MKPSFYGTLKHGLKILWKIIYFTPATPQDPKWISYKITSVRFLKLQHIYKAHDNKFSENLVETFFSQKWTFHHWWPHMTHIKIWDNKISRGSQTCWYTFVTWPCYISCRRSSTFRISNIFLTFLTPMTSIEFQNILGCLECHKDHSIKVSAQSEHF